MSDAAVRAAVEAGQAHNPLCMGVEYSECLCGEQFSSQEKQFRHMVEAQVEAARPIIAWEMMQEILADLRAARDDAQRLAGKLSSLGVDIGDAALRAGAQMPASGTGGR